MRLNIINIINVLNKLICSSRGRSAIPSDTIITEDNLYFITEDGDYMTLE